MVTKEQAIAELKRRGKLPADYEISISSNLSFPKVTKEEAVQELKRRGKLPPEYELSLDKNINEKSFNGPLTNNDVQNFKLPNRDELKSGITETLIRPVRTATEVFPLVKNAAASAIGSLPDLVGTVLNATGLPKEYLGGSIPSLTQELINLVDKYGGSVTEDKNKYLTEISKFLGSLVGTGGYGQAIKGIGAAVNAPRVEKIGNFIGKFGETNPSGVGIGASIGGGSAAAFSEENDLPIESALPLTIGASILGGKGGNIAEKGIKKVVGDKRGAYEYLASQISPEDLKNTVANAIKNDDFSFLSKETLESLSPEIRIKLETKKPFDLTSQELDTILEKGGTSDYANNLNSIQKERQIFTTLGEEAGSAQLANFEKSLANTSNVDKFDKALASRREDISQYFQKLMNKISSKDVDKESLGNTIETEVNKVYKNAEKLRKDQWNADFGEVSNIDVIEVPNFLAKLREFSNLSPDLVGNRVASNIAKRQIKTLFPKKDTPYPEDYIPTISPKNLNDKLIGLNEDLFRFPERTFSRKQVGELKKSLDMDLDLAAESGIIDASLIRNARENYRKNSEIINNFSDSILAATIKEGKINFPEKIAKSFDGMQPSQLKLTLDVLKRSDKYSEVLPNIQKYYLEKAFNEANKSKDISKFNYKKFLDTLPEDKNLEIIFGDSKIKSEIKDSIKLIRKIIKEEPVRGGSPTASRLKAQADQLEAAREATGFPDITQTPKTLVGGIYSVYDGLKNALIKKSNNLYAEIMIDPNQRKEIYKLIGKPTQKNTSLSISKKALLPAFISSTKNQTNEKNKKRFEKIFE